MFFSDSYIVTKAGLGDRLSTDLPSEMSNIPLECRFMIFSNYVPFHVLFIFMAKTQCSHCPWEGG